MLYDNKLLICYLLTIFSFCYAISTIKLVNLDNVHKVVLIKIT